MKHERIAVPQHEAEINVRIVPQRAKLMDRFLAAATSDEQMAYGDIALIACLIEQANSLPLIGANNSSR